MQKGYRVSKYFHWPRKIDGYVKHSDARKANTGKIIHSFRKMTGVVKPPQKKWTACHTEDPCGNGIYAVQFAGYNTA